MNLCFRGVTTLPTEGVRQIVTERHSAPCRRCLEDAEPGEEVLLVSYDPFPTDSPYRSASPVFVHVRPCTPHVGTEVPEQQRRRLLSVRSFDDDAMMLDADVADGRDLERLLHRLLGRPDAAFVHVHNARPGCFAVRVDRA